MAELKRTDKGLFPKGISGNPNGRRPAPIEVRELQASCKLEVMAAITDSLLLTPEDLKRKLSHPQATLAQHLVGSILTKAIQEGCFARAQFLVNYVLGRPRTFEISEGIEDERRDVKKVLEGVPSSILLEMVKGTKGSTPVE